MNHFSAKSSSTRLSLVIIALFLYTTTAPAQTLTLTVEQAVERAMTHNPSLRISKELYTERRAASWQAATRRLPRLDFRGNFVRFDPGFFPEQAQFISNARLSGQLRASHTVISGGEVQGQSKSASSLARVAKFDHESNILNTAQIVRTAFFDALLARRLVEVASEAVSINEEEVRRSKVQFEIGEAAKINVLRAEVQLANSIPELSRAQHNHRLAKAFLANLIGYDIDPSDLEANSLVLEGTLDSDRRLALPPLGRLIGAALDNRAELQSARHATNAARGEAKASWASVLPRLDVYGAYNWTSTENTFRVFGPSGLISEQPLDFNLQGWEIGATASLPIFDFLGNYQSVRAGRAKVRQAEIAEQDLRRQIDLDVRTAYSAYLESVESITSQEKNVERARESLRLARQLQSAGEATQLEVQQSQHDLTLASSLSAEANRDLLLAETALLTSIGLATLEAAARYGVVVK
ncbi:MAG: TolC family protein, partial [candidate division Zixibacteria bacterium]|nr:TolC family protein [candidate division Zixibacteria bacterium]